MDNWEILSLQKLATFNSDTFIDILLKNRGIKNKKDKEDFLNPDITKITLTSLGINLKEVSKTIERIEKAIKNNDQIIIYGDYDVDGVCATAILWETLRDIGANVMPYIPHRLKHGYGLSAKGIDDMLSQFPKTKLVFTVDNGIVANQGILHANKKGIDVIITDHHLPSQTLPKAFAIVHSTQVCGAAVAWILAEEIKKQFKHLKEDDHLELVALATVADLMPLSGPNRALLKKGLSQLRQTKRIGLLEIIEESQIKKEGIGTYEIGHIIAPRINAMGRLEHAIDSLRLICTTNKIRATQLAKKLGLTNKDRQKLTIDTVVHARDLLKEKKMNKLIIISHDTYEEGIIGLVAGRLTEEFYRPSIVISKGELISKASARSVKGFNIIEFIRQSEEFLINAGGHPGAAGFSFETKNLEILENKLNKLAEKLIDEKLLTKKIRIDIQLPLSMVGEEIYYSIEKLQPFGMGNPQPTFVARNIVVEGAKLVGMDGKHLKLTLRFGKNPRDTIQAIAFGIGERISEVKNGAKIDIAYTIEENMWNGSKTYQIKVKEFTKLV